MGFETGTGRTIGGPSTPLPREVETTAYVETNKMMMGITLDSLSKPVSDIDRDATWKYKSNANNPSIAPLTHLRVNLKGVEEENTAWIDKFKKLLDQLPEDVKNELLRQSALPADKRDESYVALDKLLANLSILLAFFDNVSFKDTPGLEKNLQLLNQSLQASYYQTVEILSGGNTHLNSVGHQDPNFEALAKLSSQIQADLDDIRELLRKENKKELSKLAKEMEMLNVQFQRLYAGEALHILGSTLEIIILTVAAKTLNSNTAPLLLGLTAALTGFFEENNQIQNLIHQLSVFLQPLLKEGNVGEERLLPLLATVLVVAAASIASLNDIPDLKLSLSFLLSSGILDEVSHELALSLGASENNAPLVAAFLNTSILLTLIQSTESSVELIETISPYLLNYLTDIDEAISDGKVEISPEIATLIKQGQIALEDQDTHALNQLEEAFFEAISEQIKEELKSQLAQLAEFIKLLRQSLQKEDSAMDNVGTGVMLA